MPTLFDALSRMDDERRNGGVGRETFAVFLYLDSDNPYNVLAKVFDDAKEARLFAQFLTSPSVTAEQVATTLQQHCEAACRLFCAHYRGFGPDPADAAVALRAIAEDIWSVVVYRLVDGVPVDEFCQFDR